MQTFTFQSGLIQIQRKYWDCWGDEMIYIPIWFNSNDRKRDRLPQELKIYIPIWFNSNPFHYKP